MGVVTFDLPLPDPADLATWGFFLGPARPRSGRPTLSWFAPLRLLMDPADARAVESTALPSGIDPVHPTLVVQVLLASEDGATFESWWSGDRDALVVTMLGDDGTLSASDPLTLASLAELVADHLAFRPTADDMAHAPLGASLVLMHVEGDRCTDLVAFEFAPDPEELDAVLLFERGVQRGLLRSDVAPLIVGLAAGDPDGAPHPRVAIGPAGGPPVAGEESPAWLEELVEIGEAATLELTAQAGDAELLLLSGPRGTLRGDERAGDGTALQAEERGVLVGLASWLGARADDGALDHVVVGLRATTASGATVVLEQAFVLDPLASAPTPTSGSDEVLDGAQAPALAAPDPLAMVAYVARELRDAVTQVRPA